MRHGGHIGDMPLRLVRKSKGVFYGAVHERVHVEGRVGQLRMPLLHHSTGSVSSYMKKLNGYTAFEARLLVEKKA